jgi:hypothetical protein
MTLADFYQPDKARTIRISEKSVDFLKIQIRSGFFPEVSGKNPIGRLSSVI